MLPTLLVAIVLALGSAAEATAADWLSLRTPDLRLIGDAGERELRDVALRFDRFREAIAAAVPAFAPSRPVPPVVVFVFRNGQSFEPFLPRYAGKAVPVSGYAVSGRDVNYVAMAGNARGLEFQAVYHEYAHLLLQHAVTNPPAWLDEGIAEYLSTFEAVGRDRANVGAPILAHVRLLRERQMPLAQLFAVTHESPDYNEGARRGLFYAQSWALMHHVLVGRPDRLAPLRDFLARHARGAPIAEAFVRAFGFPTTVLDEELRLYVRRPRLGFAAAALEAREAERTPAAVTPLSEPEADAWLGDLLAHAGRTDEAVTRLERALAADPAVALAHASLGAILMRRQESERAMVHLQRAVALDSSNEFVYFHYGAALVGRAAAPPRTPETRAALPSAVGALHRALELRPSFSEAGTMLGFAHLLLDDAETAREALQRVRTNDPDNERAALMLGQAELRLGNRAAALAMLQPLAAYAAEPGVTAEARRVLAQAADGER